MCEQTDPLTVPLPLPAAYLFIRHDVAQPNECHSYVGEVDGPSPWPILHHLQIMKLTASGTRVVN